jgi:diaminopimelate epimerase
LINLLFINLCLIMPVVITLKFISLMSKEHFYKMQGLGNDFIIFDKRSDNTTAHIEAKAQTLSHRNFGIGADQLIILKSTNDADTEMLIYNQDGSKAAACGNACRCVGKLLGKPQGTIKVGERILDFKRLNDEIMVNMGQVSFAAAQTLFATQVHFANVGNPHVVVIAYEGDKEVFGKQMQKEIAGGVNVNFVEVIASDKVNLTTFERA